MVSKKNGLPPNSSYTTIDYISAEIENTKTYIAGSVADMQSLLVDADEYVPKKEEAFQKVEDERVRASCNFRKVCDSKTSS